MHADGHCGKRNKRQYFRKHRETYDPNRLRKNVAMSRRSRMENIRSSAIGKPLAHLTSSSSFSSSSSSASLPFYCATVSLSLSSNIVIVTSPMAYDAESRRKFEVATRPVSYIASTFRKLFS